ncbi:LOW QUALITY PROTEIN: craniofacial development protein 1 [Dromiciops gliroides]|uniref:LOW QUALITY PROTEIN: craniofacial development protein 1 n=1 Tax=Dromiciops gliroides TaxID=33562 RepID=UPI001CC3374A|nr:LOW QUALITY PROTEIN: craniofacial development protein 1 [Dromiciops gliroides]
MDGYDSEDFSSSEEDEDYVPSGGEYSEDDVNELLKEDEVEDEEKTQKSKGKKRDSRDTKMKSLGVGPRKRKKGGLLMEDKEETDDKVEAEAAAEGNTDEEEEKAVEPEKSIPSEEEKKRQDDALWASFLNDVGPKAQARPARSQAKTEGEGQEKSSDRLLVTAKESEKPSEREKVKITKVFDFAGEEVRVTKEVDVASKEAKSFFKQNEKEKPPTGVPSVPSALPTGSGLKRPSGMSSLLGKIGAKKQKMSTLEKSKLDWESFKEEEGIGEELAIHNRGKEGYIERKAFLERVDHRQFEIERDLRLSKMKP